MDLTIPETVDLVLVAGYDESVLEQIAEQTDATTIIYTDIKDIVPPKGGAVISSISEIRHACRRLGQDLSREHEAMVIGDDADPRREELELAWDHGANTGYCAAMGGTHACTKRVRGMLESLHLLISNAPINLAKGTCEGVPGIVVGAGPSAASQLAGLGRIWTDSVTACVNTSLPMLRHARLKPDMCIICEQKDIASTLDPAHCDNVIMVPGSHVAGSTWQLPWAARAPALSREGLFGAWLCDVYDLDQIWIGSSAVTLAAGVLYELGCDPIILVGCDCAPAVNGEFYADGAAFAGTRIKFEDGMGVMERSELKAQTDGTTTKPDHLPAVKSRDWDGNERWTLINYDAIAQWFEDMATAWHRTLINASVGGLNIIGWKNTPINDIELDPSVVNCTLPKIYAKLVNGTDVMKERTLVELEHQRQGAMKIGDLADEARKLCVKLRDLQVAIATFDDGAALIDAYTWGPLEIVRQEAKGKPVIEHLGDVFAEIEQRSRETSELITDAQERING